MSFFRCQACITQTTVYVSPFFLQASSWPPAQELGEIVSPITSPHLDMLTSQVVALFHQPICCGKSWPIARRLLPLPEKWFTVACHLCGIFAGGLAGSKPNQTTQQQQDPYKCRVGITEQLELQDWCLPPFLRWSRLDGSHKKRELPPQLLGW